MAGQLKRENPHLREDVVLIRALRDSNLPKFLADDAILFKVSKITMYPLFIINFYYTFFLFLYFNLLSFYPFHFFPLLFLRVFYKTCFQVLISLNTITVSSSPPLRTLP